MTLWICLSSDATRRYRDDILRALALPIGGRLQFRYRTKLVSNAALQRIRRGDVQGQQVILSFLDREAAPTAVPCRVAKLVATKEVGSWIVLTLKVGNYAFAENLAAWNGAITVAGQRANAEPPTAAEVQKTLDLPGHYCYTIDGRDIDADACGFLTSDSVETWQKVVDQLHSRRGFREIWTFFRADGFAPPVEIVGGIAALHPDTTYTLRIQHYHPEDREIRPAIIEVRTTNTSLSFLDARQLVDSPYDEKSVRFRTGRPLDSESGIIYVELSSFEASASSKPALAGSSSSPSAPTVGEAASVPEFPGAAGEWLFDIPFVLTPNKFRTWVQIAALTILLAAPHALRSSVNGGWLVLIALGSSLVAAYVAIFNLKKSL